MPLTHGDELAEYFATLLRVPRSRISTVANVLDLGADSIMLLEARTWIETRYGQRIEIRRFFEDLTTIEAIAAFLAEAPVGGAAGRTIEPPSAEAEHAAERPAVGRSDAATADLRLMRSQLQLVAEVIEAQNRAAARLRRRSEAPQATALQETEATAA